METKWGGGAVTYGKGPWRAYAGECGEIHIGDAEQPASAPIATVHSREGNAAAADMIAAAPQMFAALRRARAFIRSLPGGGQLVLDAIEDAMTSAEEGAEAAVLMRAIREKERNS